MSKVVGLPSARHGASRDNLARFIERARTEVAAFGADLDFDAVAWETRRHVTVRPSKSPPPRLWFTANPARLGTHHSAEPMPEPFGSFAKAVIRLRQEFKPTKTSPVMLRALRYLCRATTERGVDPTLMTALDFQRAIALCREVEKHESAYRVGTMLASLAEMLNDEGLTAVRITFKNPVSRPEDGLKFGGKAERRRAQKLPSEETLQALGEISNRLTQDSDILRMRVVELLSCGGWRINEALTLPADCEVWDEPTKNGQPILDSQGQPVRRYGIRYFAEKTGRPDVKWIPSAMVDVARRAIADIRRITEPFRESARWMHENPGRARLPGKWHELPEDAVIPAPEVALMFGCHPGAGMVLLNNWKVPTFRQGPKRRFVRRSDLEAAILREQRADMVPDLSLPKHEYLMLMPRNWSHARRGVLESIVVHVHENAIFDFITGSPGTASVFQRFGFLDTDGTPLRMTSHQLRHWLNTLAQEGGMPQLQLARWSGRTEVSQNAAYNHVSAVALAEKARETLSAGRVVGPIQEAHDRLPPLRREDWARAVFATAHITDIGLCANDWSMLPCQAHGACAGCAEHLVIRGDAAQSARARAMLDDHERLLTTAEAEAADGTYGASNYVAHHRKMVDALRAILAVHDDGTIPTGTLVQLSWGRDGRPFVRARRGGDDPDSREG